MVAVDLWHPLFRRYFPVTAGRSAYWYASQDGPVGDFSGSGGSAENSEQRAIGKITIKRNMVKICKNHQMKWALFRHFP